MCYLDSLVQQRNALIAEIQSLKEDHELQLNAMNVTHEMAIHSLQQNHEREVEIFHIEGRKCI